MQSNESRQVEISGSYTPSWAFLYSSKHILQLGLLLLVFAYLYAPAFEMLYRTWLKRGDHSHGFLIPLISFYLIWLRRETLGHTQVQPAYLWGIPVMIAAGVMLLVGKVGSVISLQEYSIIVMIVGLVLCLFGKDCLKVLSLPIAYLIFMIPFQDEVAGPLYWPLQLLGARIAGSLLEAFSIPVFVEHQFIMLPGTTLEVIRGCSGISSLLSLLAIGIPLAFMTQKRVWCRVVLLLSVPVFGLVANWMRLFSMGFWGYYYGAVLQEPFHSIQGLFFAQIGFVFLFVVAWILSNVPALPPQIKPPQLSKIVTAIGNGDNRSHQWNQPWLAALVVLFAFTGYLHFYDPKHVPPNLKLTLFPFTVGSWNGDEGDLQKLAFRVKRADHELVRTYQSPSGREFQLYVAYIESQRQSKEIVNWRTAVLHENSKRVDIPIDQRVSISVNYIANLPLSSKNKFLARNGQRERHIFFWYDVNGRILADRYKAKLATILDALIYGRTNGAFVLVSASSDDQGTEAETIREERALIQHLVPLLRNYIR